MDRRNGDDPLAPPRPPKLLPRVHRPRAPEPTMMSAATTATATTIATTAHTSTPQCTNSNQQEQHLSNINNNSSQQQQQHHSITTATTTTNLYSHNRNNNTNNQNTNNNNVNNVVITVQPEFEDQIHHLTILPQRPSSLSRNSSQVSTSSLSSITAGNSFARRRPPQPTGINIITPGAAVPLLTITGNGSIISGGSSTNLGSNFLSHFHNADPVPASPVTLAQPRPESERLTNEYVETPLRTAQQLQLLHASRAQHPAGQHDNGQTTTHHLLLLPQRESRQHQQQQLHSTNRLAGTAGSANVTTVTEDTDGFLHSHNNHNHKLSTTSTAATKTSTTTCPHTGKVAPPSRGFATPSVQPITQPITKQPALSSVNNINSCKFAKDLPAFDDLLDLHNIATGIATPQGMVSAVNGASPLGTPIIIGGGDPISLNPIMCPHCERCRCEQCQSPRPLPQTWICNKSCLCSAESIIDYASCLCCAKALFYHCARDNDMDCDDGSGTPCVDNPCSCGPYKRTQRWGWLGALSLVLPCLWCYWPMRGCVSLCEKCYGRYMGRGCRCQHIGSTSSMLPIAQLGTNDNGVVGNGQSPGSQMATSKSMGGSGGGHHHHHHHSECSASSRILRKGEFTPEKRLLDSSPEY